MINKHSIILMTKLAVYDKHEGDADRLANEYFRHDYIYRKNLGTRLSVGIGGLLLVAVHWLKLLFIDGGDIFAMDLEGPITDSVMFLLALLAVYTLIGTIQQTRQYYLIQKRLYRYQALTHQLERINERDRQQAETGRSDTRRTDLIRTDTGRSDIRRSDIRRTDIRRSNVRRTDTGRSEIDD